MDPEKDSFEDSESESDSSDNECELFLCEWTYVWKVPKILTSLTYGEDEADHFSEFIQLPNGDRLQIYLTRENANKYRLIGEFDSRVTNNNPGGCSAQLKEIVYRLHYYGCSGTLNKENKWDQMIEIKTDKEEGDPDRVDENIYLRLIFGEQEPRSLLQTVMLQDDIDTFQTLSRELSDARDVEGDVTFEFPNRTQAEADNQDGESSLKRQKVCLTAHRWLLIARSSVFRAMFQTQMSEELTRKVEIVDCTVQKFELFLQFLYKGYLESNQNLVTYLALSRLAYKYDVPSINEAIRYKIPGMLRLHRMNIILILSHADTYQDLELLEKAIDFVVKNAKQLKENTLDFFVNNPSLSKKIMTALIDNM